jgi:hypothetical protein
MRFSIPLLCGLLALPLAALAQDPPEEPPQSNEAPTPPIAVPP